MSDSHRIQVRVPDAWKTAIERAADKHGTGVSQFVRHAILQQLTKRDQKALAEVRRGRPKTE